MSHGKSETHEDKRHADPEHGNLSSGEKAWLSRGHIPHTVEGNAEKEAAAQEWMEEHQKGGAHHHTAHGEEEEEPGEEDFKDLTPAERAVLSRGQRPKSLEGASEEKQQLAERYVEYKKSHPTSHHRKK